MDVNPALASLLQAPPPSSRQAPVGDPPWLAAARHAARERLLRHGLPSPRLEDWKFTSLDPLERLRFRPAGQGAGVAPSRIAAMRLPEGRSHLMVFVNGHFRPDLSDLCRLPGGVVVDSLAALLRSTPELVEPHFTAAHGSGPADGLLDLNAALAADGVVISLAPGTALDWPVHLLHVGAPGAAPETAQLRNLVIAGAGAIVTFVEEYAGEDGGAWWTNAATRIVAERGAAVRHFKLQREGAAAFHSGRTEVDLQRDAAYTNAILSLGAQLSRQEVHATFSGENVHCRLSGVALARGRQHVDHTVRLDHAQPRGQSVQNYRSVVDDHGHAVFQGRIRVAPDAQRSDAQQLNRALLLAAGAQTDAKPELEILADDVKCSHGASVGDLDPQSLFYLLSRGIDRDTARGLLVEAFVAEILDDIEPKTVGRRFREVFAHWLGGRA